MKELSIEEKAKAYDKVREKIKVRFGTNVAEEIFSVFEESEDERIRKIVINLLKQSTYENCVYEGVKMKDIYAWLEKQGGIAKLTKEEEQNRFAKGVLSSCALSFIHYLDAHKYEGKMCVSNAECEDIENAFHNAMWDILHRYYCKYIKKQDEQKQDPCEHCKDKYLNCRNFPCINKRAFEQGKSVWEIINEEKVDNENCVNSTDKVKSKFNEK